MREVHYCTPVVCVLCTEFLCVSKSLHLLKNIRFQSLMNQWYDICRGFELQEMLFSKYVYEFCAKF